MLVRMYAGEDELGSVILEDDRIRAEALVMGEQFVMDRFLEPYTVEIDGEPLTLDAEDDPLEFLFYLSRYWRSGQGISAGTVEDDDLPEDMPDEGEDFVENAFCPTGEGGGQDNSCGPGGKPRVVGDLKTGDVVVAPGGEERKIFAADKSVGGRVHITYEGGKPAPPQRASRGLASAGVIKVKPKEVMKGVDYLKPGDEILGADFAGKVKQIKKVMQLGRPHIEVQFEGPSGKDHVLHFAPGYRVAVMPKGWQKEQSKAASGTGATGDGGKAKSASHKGAPADSAKPEFEVSVKGGKKVHAASVKGMLRAFDPEGAKRFNKVLHELGAVNKQIKAGKDSKGLLALRAEGIKKELGEIRAGARERFAGKSIPEKLVRPQGPKKEKIKVSMVKEPAPRPALDFGWGNTPKKPETAGKGVSAKEGRSAKFANAWADQLKPGDRVDGDLKGTILKTEKVKRDGRNMVRLKVDGPFGMEDVEVDPQFKIKRAKAVKEPVQVAPKEPAHAGVAREAAGLKGGGDTPEAKLGSGEQVAKRALGGGMMDTYVVTLDNGAKGVWKPQKGENDAHRAGIKVGTYYKREAATYDVAKAVGLDDLVPPTVKRTINGKRGSLQEFQEGAKVAKLIFDDVERFDGEKDLARGAAFDYLIGHTDRHGGNWMLTDGKLRMIDNGLAFGTKPNMGFGNYKFVERARQLKLKVPDEVAGWDKDKITTALKKAGIEDEAIGLVQIRLEKLKARQAAGKRIPEMMH